MSCSAFCGKRSPLYLNSLNGNTLEYTSNKRIHETKRTENMKLIEMKKRKNTYVRPENTKKTWGINEWIKFKKQ